MERIYNTDAYGLFHMQLPNRIYCKHKKWSTVRGVKQKKDTNRVSGMVCFSVVGKKLEQMLVGKTQRPQCWDLGDKKKPLLYTNQTNAWFDSIVNWFWFNHCFLKHDRTEFGELHGLLLADNKGCEGLCAQDIPTLMHVEPFPPMQTSRHQPADQGAIDMVKTGCRSCAVLFFVCVVIQWSMLLQSRQAHDSEMVVKV